MIHDVAELDVNVFGLCRARSAHANKDLLMPIGMSAIECIDTSRFKNSCTVYSLRHLGHNLVNS